MTPTAPPEEPEGRKSEVMFPPAADMEPKSEEKEQRHSEPLKVMKKPGNFKKLVSVNMSQLIKKQRMAQSIVSNEGVPTNQSVITVARKSFAIRSSKDSSLERGPENHRKFSIKSIKLKPPAQ